MAEAENKAEKLKEKISRSTLEAKENKELKKDPSPLDLQNYVEKLAEREGIDTKQLEKIITKSFTQFYCQGEDKDADLIFNFGKDFVIYRRYEIVKEKPGNPSREIHFEDGRLKAGGKIEGNYFLLPLNVNGLPFPISQNIRHQIRKEIQEIHKQKQLKSFKEQNNQLVQGAVIALENENCLVELEGSSTGLWPRSEWQEILRPHPKQVFHFLIDRIEEEGGRNIVYLTRNSGKFLEKIAELHVPEIRQKIIKIIKVIRIPGVLSKIIVQSTLPQVDALGTCIGPKAKRIIDISRDTYPSERVEVTSWSENKKELLLNLLLPAKVISIIEKKDFWELTLFGKQMHYLTKNRNTLLAEIGEFFQKPLKFVSYEDLQSKGSYFVVFNGSETDITGGGKEEDKEEDRKKINVNRAKNISNRR